MPWWDQNDEKMDKFFTKAASVLPLAAYIAGMPAFFVAFCLLYDPFDIMEYYSFGSFSYSFHLTMLGCIILLTMIPMRLFLHRAEKSGLFRITQYVFWCAGELFVCACFMALYTQLFRNSDGGWFQSLATCMKYSFLILCYPAVFVAFRRLLSEKKSAPESNPAPGPEDSLVKLYDEHRRLKLTISPASVLFVRAESNYVTVSYLDSGKPKEYLLRSSMKSAEESLSKFGMTRCHRSFLVNPRHVSMLGKEGDGLTYATLDTPGVPKIPVSKQYCESLSSLL